MGKEKMKILEGSFDMFLENILCGTDFKSLFYAADKELPNTFAEAQMYLRLKKFQKYEQFPDEKFRDFLDIKLPMIKNSIDYDHFIKNKMPIIKDIKNELKEGIFKLFEGKEIIYKALMKNDTLSQPHSGCILDKNNLLNYLEEMKQSNLGMTYKEAFDIKEEEVDIEVEVNILYPDLLEAMMVNSYGRTPDDNPPSAYIGKYKMQRLVNTNSKN